MNVPKSLFMGQAAQARVATTSGVPTCDALTKARQRIGFSVDTAADALHISTRELIHYETGLRSPPVDVIEEMARLYGVEPQRFGTREWVPRVPPRWDPEDNILWLGWTPISVIPRDNDHLIRSVASALRFMRSLKGTDPAYLRSAELPILSELLDLSDPNLTDLLMRYLRLNDTESLAVVNEMVMISAVGSLV